MRIARVIGQVVLSPKLSELVAGQYLLAETLDLPALEKLPAVVGRSKPMPEALVVFDQLGAGVGQLIAVSEGREACVPFEPKRVPLDAYCAAILDEVEITSRV
ncbi:MAG: hypothetical protein IT443_06955 [Phycisphaeraceae bacterium]|nr:hypothetical protein [Phycisphaeraceae bacterium]